MIFFSSSSFLLSQKDEMPINEWQEYDIYTWSTITKEFFKAVIKKAIY